MVQSNIAMYLESLKKKSKWNKYSKR
jgi:hypothetical protein